MDSGNSIFDFSRALGECQAALFAHISALMAGDAAAEDVLQETGLYIWRNREVFDPQRGTFLAWCKSMATQQVRKWRLERSREKLVFGETEFEKVAAYLHSLPPEEPGEREAALRLCLAKLKSADRKLLAKHYAGRVPQDRLALFAGISLAAMQMRFTRLRRVLAKCIAENICSVHDTAQSASLEEIAEEWRTDALLKLWGRAMSSRKRRTVRKARLAASIAVLLGALAWASQKTLKSPGKPVEETTAVIEKEEAMHTNIIAKTLALAPLAASAIAPQLSEIDVTLPEDPGKPVEISYELLSANAVVTLDVLTNGVSIGGAKLRHVAGDANKMMEPGLKSLQWFIDADWPEREEAALEFRLNAWAEGDTPDWMVLDLTAKNKIRWYESAEALPLGGVEADAYKGDCLVMRRVPARGATFWMGSPEGESGRNAANETRHQVSFSEDFYIAVYQTTRAQCKNMTGSDPSNSGTSSLLTPVQNRNWNALRGKDWPNDGHEVSADSVIGKMREFTGVDLDLPTDAQWEFACRAGTDSARYSSEALKNLAWYSGMDINGNFNGNYIPKPVGLKLPNEWGLCDCYGNIWELCLDWFQADLGTDSAVDPEGPESGTSRVSRGGAHGSGEAACRSAYRDTANPASTSPGAQGYRLTAPLSLKY